MKTPTCLFLIPFLALSSLRAEPVIDQFEAGICVNDRAETSRLEIEPRKLTVVARETEPGVFGRYGHAAVFDWRPEGSRDSEGFSIQESDEQFILRVTGMEKIAPEGAQESTGIRVHIYFYRFGSGAALPESGYIPDQVANSGSSWSFDVRAFAISQFGGEDKLPDNLVWRPEFYISTQNQEGVGFSFESISAVNTLE